MNITDDSMGLWWLTTAKLKGDEVFWQVILDLVSFRLKLLITVAWVVDHMVFYTWDGCDTTVTMLDGLWSLLGRVAPHVVVPHQ